MHPQTLKAAYGCLLHDFGKIVYRAGGGSGSHSLLGWQDLSRVLTGESWQPVLDCLRWHHASELRRDKPEKGSLAYIACIADNLSAAADRRETETEGGGFARRLSLSPVFCHMNGEHPGFSIDPKPQDGRLRQPLRQDSEIPAGRYEDARREIKAAFPGNLPEESWLNSLLGLLEVWTDCFPSSTNLGESPDISLYDHLKTTAAIGCCISEYLLEQGEQNFKSRLFEGENSFRAEKAFLLYSADLSGIQDFIYTVTDSGALRSFRSRSFFLGLLMEHYVDELLRGCGLCRANLLYSGGGHCYILLPNTSKVRLLLEDYNRRFNDFLIEEFGSRLFIAQGWTECSGNELTNTPGEESPYKEMFGRVSRRIAAHKLHRYSPQQLRMLNSREQPGERECSVCGRTDKLEDKEPLCSWCRSFRELSGKIQQKDVYVVSSRNEWGAELCLPALEGEAYISFTDEQEARRRLKESGSIIRVYTKNKSCTGFRYSTKINVGDYHRDNRMDRLADSARGIRRIAVCRMDVDDLGQAFVSGFERPGASGARERSHYVTLSRTAAFSRQMSLFFQRYINDILSGEYNNCRALDVSIVYSGGDDVFLVGAWNDVVEAANRIQSAFSRFCCGSLSISGGLGIFDEHFPIRISAGVTATLEERAKAEPGKNSLVLFEDCREHCYGWQVFREKVLGEKVKALEDFFKDNDDRGNSFLYKILELLRRSRQPGAGINLARYAYLLARQEPRKSDPKWKSYRSFADKMYGWALNREDKRQLITAIYIYVYENRGE